MQAVVCALARVRTGENIAALAALAATNSNFRDLCLPFLFSHVRWPHPDKHDEETGLHFFPEHLWPLFRSTPFLFYPILTHTHFTDASISSGQTIGPMPPLLAGETATMSVATTIPVTPTSSPPLFLVCLVSSPFPSAVPSFPQTPSSTLSSPAPLSVNSG